MASGEVRFRLGELDFVWREAKAIVNRKKHGVTFESAATAFQDKLAGTIYDSDHAIDEHRYLLMGQDASGRLLVVSFTDWDGIVRIVSARLATRRERWDYENG